MTDNLGRLTRTRRMEPPGKAPSACVRILSDWKEGRGQPPAFPVGGDQTMSAVNRVGCVGNSSVVKRQSSTVVRRRNTSIALGMMFDAWRLMYLHTFTNDV